MFLVLDEALCRDRAAWSAPFDELVDLQGDGSWCARITGTLEILLAPERAELEGELDGLVPRACDLCLGSFLEPVSVAVDDLCLIEDNGPAEAVFDEDDEVWRAGSEARWDLTEIARQAVLLALPTRALCRPECPARALMGQPTGRPTGLDPRLAPLAGLLSPEVPDGRPEEENE